MGERSNPARGGPAGAAAAEPAGGGDRRELAVPAPVTGRVVPLEEVPDPVFAERMVGDGMALDPQAGPVIAPLAGTVTALFPTGHAVGLRTPEGVELLIHLGIDSAHAEGAFEALVAVGQQVEAGQPLIRIDLERLKAGARSPLSPVLVTNLDELGGRVAPVAQGTALAGKSVLFRVVWAAGPA
ncbi:PTS sugar transporter subunit IIA [Thermaerobacter subterraneus]|uniref:PTS system protein IIA component, Glc family n=1 Tax=Thermaerobacter subterraneus DSM 13965 TaxID=867903 RepID=K6Q2I3_9FIRM|nr:PTS glucose transporter subunit IIA [Thermaerobacter subterraneus]EKP95418.1 PTS system protein IIA component, Glc family [Thermaerobacter subterraneus DSM 13965]